MADDYTVPIVLGVGAVIAVAVGAALLEASASTSTPSLLSFNMKLVNADTNAVIAGGSVTYGSTTKVTDSSGVASFAGVPAGPLPLSASASGYQSYGPTQFSPADGGSYDIPLVPTSGGIPYGESFVYQSAPVLSDVEAQVNYENQNVIPITASAYCTVKSGTQTVAEGNSAPQTLQPTETGPFTVSLNTVLPAGSYVFEFFCVDTLNRPVSPTTSVPVTLG